MMFEGDPESAAKTRSCKNSRDISRGNKSHTTQNVADLSNRYSATTVLVKKRTGVYKIGERRNDVDVLLSLH